LDIFVIGGGGLSKVLISVLKKTPSLNIVGYVDIVDKGKILGAPYLGNDDTVIYNEVRNVAIGICYTASALDSTLRRNLLNKYVDRGFRFPPIISPDALVYTETQHKPGTLVLDRAIINAGAEVGSYCLVNTGAIIEHDCLVGNHSIISSNATLGGHVELEGSVFIGIGSTVKDGVKIGKDIVVGAGSSVISDLYEAGTYYGNPAKLQPQNKS